MKPVTYVLGPDGVPVLEPDIEKWGKSRNATRRVGLTQIGDARISTIFRGFDDRAYDTEPLLLWETMVFGGEMHSHRRRYASREDAERGHNEIVGRLTREAPPKGDIEL